MINNQDRSDFIRRWIFIFITLIFITSSFYSTFNFVNITGISMYPTIKEGDRTFIKMLGNKTEHGHIIVFKKSKDHLLIKRIIGNEGDHLVIRNQFVYLNGVLLEEDYLHKPDRTTLPNIKIGHDINIIIPKNQVFVMGDNRDKSWDSRHFGVIPVDDIIGSLIFKF